MSLTSSIYLSGSSTTPNDTITLNNGGTTTPTQVTIAKIQSVFKGIALWWDYQRPLTNPDGFQAQVSDDQVSWYSLKFDGTDWKDTLDALTPVPTAYLLHSNIPFGGTADAPIGKTLYYRIRRLTKAGATGTWSAVQSSTTSTVNSGELAVNSIYGNNIRAGELDVYLAKILYSLTIGYSGSGTYAAPAEGDRRAYVDDDELRFEEYTNGGWSTVKGIKIGGALAGLFLSMISCNMWFNPQADLPSSAELLPTPRAHIYNFENNWNDQDGDTTLSPSGTAGLTTSYKKFGSYSMYSTSGSASADTADLGFDMTNDSLGVGAWYLFRNIGSPTDKGYLAIAYTLDTTYWGNYLRLIYDPYTYSGTNQVRFAVEMYYQDGSGWHDEFVWSDLYANSAIADGNWHYLNIFWNASTKKITLVKDLDVFTSSTTITLPSDTVINSYFQIYAHEASGSDVKTDVNADEADLFWGDSIDTDMYLQHYNHNVAWNTNYSAKDLILKPASGGRIIFDGTVGTDTWHTVGATGEPAFINSWAATTTQRKLRYKKDALGYVHIEGCADCSSATAKEAFLLPTGYRPSVNIYFAGASWDGTNHVHVELLIAATGYVSNIDYSGKSDTKIFVVFYPD